MIDLIKFRIATWLLKGSPKELPNKQVIEPFKPEATSFVGSMKKQFRDFIEGSMVIDVSTKNDLIEELGDNCFDTRFDGSVFLEEAVGNALFRWRKENHKIMELWREIVVNNSKINNFPHEVADKAVARFKAAMDVEDHNNNPF